MSRKPRFWIGLLFALLIVAGLFRLRFDVDVLNLLPGDLPVVQGLKLYQHNFTDARELILTVKAPDAAKAESAARNLAVELRAQTNLVESVMWQPIWLERPAQATELIAYLWLNQPPAVFAEMANRLMGTNISATLDDAREQLATSLSPLDLARRGYDPFNLMELPANVSAGAVASFGEGQNFFASADGDFRILFVKARPELSNYQTCIVWMRDMEAFLNGARKRGLIPADVAVAFTGSPAFTAEISSGMQRDMFTSIGMTSVIIAILFWIFHRRLVPMLWLLVLLGLILGCTLAFGGLLFGAINVVSLGFAGILLGLAVDYGVVHYQEALASPDAIIPEIRRAIGPSIFWAAVTTISAFLVLNLGGLPGLSQLGSLVALGVMLSALVMLFAFLPPLFRDRLKKRMEQIAAGKSPQLSEAHHSTFMPPSPLRVRITFAVTILACAAGLVVLARGVPGMDHSANALRPRNSPSYTALEQIKSLVTQNREPIWIIARNTNAQAIAAHLDAAQPILEAAVSNGVIGSFTLPTPLWPRTDYQMTNRAAAGKLAAERDVLRAAILDHGFTTNALTVTDNILNTWQNAQAQPGIFWPTNEMSRWIFDKVIARPKDEFLAVGFLFAATNRPAAAPLLSGLTKTLADEDFIVSGWDLLGASILQRVEKNLWKLVLPMVGLILLSLWLAFRRPAEIILSIAVLAMSGFCLLTVMKLSGWSWNLLNLMALPLMLGSGVDYSIFMQLALRRHHGDLAAAHRSVGRALLLCGGTAVAGFGSLAFSTNAGMASLGEVCAIGIGCNMLISVLLLPVWWLRVAGSTAAKTAEPPAPSSLYRTGFWKLGLAVTRWIPRPVACRLAKFIARLYWRFAPHRREIVVQNLLPVLNGQRADAEKKGRELIGQFALKVADLWRYESGLPVEDLFGEWTGWEHFEEALASKRGILLVTPHLGNWEFGGPLLTRRGVNLQVITLAEPGRGFTELRQASRARWDIDTLVIGEDPFAFVEVIRRLEAGATVALLIDRPPKTSSVTVELFGRPFAASIAAAELARASGCVLLPACLPHTSHGYAAHILPPIDYDRGALRQREARAALTQKIVRAFEPAIREHLDQWYHFVPLWNSGGQ
jgi:predicted RND superfamily exporter protein/lauroyl/myristoyl acyltransferase